MGGGKKGLAAPGPPTFAWYVTPNAQPPRKEPRKEPYEGKEWGNNESNWCSGGWANGRPEEKRHDNNWNSRTQTNTYSEGNSSDKYREKGPNPSSGPRNKGRDAKGKNKGHKGSKCYGTHWGMLSPFVHTKPEP